MSKVVYKKRLAQLTPPKTKKPGDYNKQDIVELFTELAAEGVISSETMATIHAKQSEKGFAPYKCLTDKELHSLCYLCSPEKREATKERALDPLWRNLCDLEIEDIERLDKLINKYK